MEITEILVTGFDGDEAVFAVTLTPGDATTVLAGTDEDGEVAVDAVTRQETDVFASMRELLEGLIAVSAQG